MTANFNFTVTTDDLIIKFSCANHKKRIDATRQQCALFVQRRGS